MSLSPNLQQLQRTGKAASGRQHHGNLFHRPLSLQSQRSPRKRKRSSPLSEPAKLPRVVGRSDNFDDDGDDLDQLGLAAVEQYELTQRERSMSPKDPIPPQIPLSRPIQAGSTSPVNVVETPCPARARSSTQPSSSSSGISNLPLAQAAVAGCGNSESGGIDERVKSLQEQNYTKDGEVKVLRGEKDRLLGELRKMEEKMKQTKAQLLSEKRERERELMKVKISLETKLQFKEQEIVSLQDKLEKQSHGIANHSTSPGGVKPSKSSRRSPFSIPDSSVSTKGKGKAAGSSSSNRPVEFLSTENFFPLSQLSQDSGVMSVSPVVGVAMHRQSKDPTRASGSQGTDKGRSRSISPSPSDLKKMKKRSVSDRGDSTNARKKLRSVKSPSSSEPGSSCGGEDVAMEMGEFPLNMSVPGRELDGAQVLMLLLNLNLLRPPFCLRQAPALAATMELSSQDSSSSSCSSGSSSLEHHQIKLDGLLSLLPRGGVANSSYSSLPNFSTPDREAATLQYHRSTSSDSDHSLMTTPTRHAPQHPLKPHTVARSNLTQRIRRNSGLLTANRKAFSTSNTPIKAPPTTSSNSASSSLLSSINASSLQRNIGNLLASSEVARFASFSSSSSSSLRHLCRGKGSLLSSSLKSFSPGESGDTDVMEILKLVGQLITRYHREQESKAKIISLSDSSESTDGSFTLSPKTSSSVSRSSSSDIAPPSLGDQVLTIQALEILEVLVMYSQRVREQILLQPPVFAIDSRPSSSLDIHQNPPSLNTSLEGVRMEGVESGGATPSNLLVEASHRLVSLRRKEEGDSQSSSEPGEVSEVGRSHQLNKQKQEVPETCSESSAIQ